MKVLVLNAGSSTLKFSLVESTGETVLADGLADWSITPCRLNVRRPGQPEAQSALTLKPDEEPAAQALAAFLQGDTALLRDTLRPEAIGHRVVHGGERYTTAVRVTPEVKSAIADLAELAPLHNPGNRAGIEAAEKTFPGVPNVAAFDTAFHATIPSAARIYPLPRQWTQRWHLRRYGFHGLSHAYCTGRAAQMLGNRSGLRLVICHLGNGCSLSAVRDGICLDTSMGFTPLAGVMMATRSGSVDPGLLLYLLRRGFVTVEQMEHALNHEAGLLGVSGVSGDMRQVLATAEKGNADAKLALDLYAHRIRQTIGAMTATLGGLDALVFTAGVGEHSAEVRRLVCTGLEFLGLRVEEQANASCHPDTDIATPDSPAQVLVLATREDLMIVRETVRVLG